MFRWPARPRPLALAQLFAEELGAVLQVREADEARVGAVFAKHGPRRRS